MASCTTCPTSMLHFHVRAHNNSLSPPSPPPLFSNTQCHLSFTLISHIKTYQHIHSFGIIEVTPADQRPSFSSTHYFIRFGRGKLCEGRSFHHHCPGGRGTSSSDVIKVSHQIKRHNFPLLHPLIFFLCSPLFHFQI